jgi:hypothetical protein
MSACLRFSLHVYSTVSILSLSGRGLEDNVVFGLFALCAVRDALFIHFSFQRFPLRLPAAGMIWKTGMDLGMSLMDDSGLFCGCMGFEDGHFGDMIDID